MKPLSNGRSERWRAASKPGQRRRNPVNPASALAVGLAALLVTVVAGAMIALAPVVAAAVGLAGAVTVIGFLLPLPWLMVLTLFISAVVAGSAEYFLHLAQANWVPFILACLIALRSVVEGHLGFRPRSADRQKVPRGLAWFGYPAAVYFAVFLASAFANLIPGAQATAALKNYLMMWGVLMAFTSTASGERMSLMLWRSVVVVAIVQLPVVLFQRVFVSSRLSNSASSLSFDAINGTFGGGLTGGRSGALAMFVCIALAYLLILWRERRLSGLSLFGLLMLLLPTLFIVEVKAVIFWLPIVAFIVFAAQIRRHPFRFVIGVLTSVLTVLAVIAAYRYSYYASGSDRSITTFFERDLVYMWDPNRYNPATKEMGRMSALVHWWRETGGSDLAHILFGYGPGASRGVSTVAVGAVAARYPFYVDISAAAALLWDLGIVGTVAFCATLMLGVLQARVLTHSSTLSHPLRIQMEAGMIGLLLILSSVVYVRDSIDGSTIQFMIFFCLGQVALGRRLVAAAADSGATAASARAKTIGPASAPREADL